MGFLANMAVLWIAFFLMAIMIVMVVFTIANGQYGFAIGAGVCALIFGVIWYYSATHRVVPPNTRWMYIDNTTGEIEGAVRASGLTKKPFAFYSLKKFPGAAEQPFCLEFYPALNEGYEVKAKICGTYDAANLDWAGQYRLHNFSSEADLLAFWDNQGKDSIRGVFHNINYSQITTDPVTVSTSVGTAFTDWLSTTQGIVAHDVTLSNWNLTSAEVQAQVDEASAESFQKTVERQKLDAAEIARERQIYEIETANQVLAARGVELKFLFEELGITDNGAMAQIIQTMTWYGFAQNPPSGVQVIVGANSVAVPVRGSNNAPAAVPQVTATPQK